MEDKINTNAGMRIGQGGHDIKVCQWNMSGSDDEKAEDFGLYMQHHNIGISFLIDIRLTANECELAKRKLKSLFVEDCHISASAVEDPGTAGGKVGGQLVIARGAWWNAVRTCTTDRAGL